MLWLSAPHCGVFHNWLCNYSTVLNPLSTIVEGHVGATLCEARYGPTPVRRKWITV
jgi:hypothetical protein